MVILIFIVIIIIPKTEGNVSKDFVFYHKVLTWYFVEGFAHESDALITEHWKDVWQARRYLQGLY